MPLSSGQYDLECWPLFPGYIRLVKHCVRSISNARPGLYDIRRFGSKYVSAISYAPRAPCSADMARIQLAHGNRADLVVRLYDVSVSIPRGKAFAYFTDEKR